jgi:hypothetical protein
MTTIQFSSLFINMLTQQPKANFKANTNKGRKNKHIYTNKRQNKTTLVISAIAIQSVKSCQREVRKKKKICQS